uniref:Uncharacterized protein n=1 Tax=Tanacetum cinerariifolium TaxID=118510 RepID=A0A699K3J0_TANCI|nr:hypothetical protein [Tanacetum cinerariifolium]
MNQNYFDPNPCYDSHYSGFDQPPQYPVIHHPLQETSVEMLQARENLMKSIQTFLKKFDYISFGERLITLLLAHERFSEIKQAFREEQHQPENIQELLRKLLNDLKVLNGVLPERGEHGAQISTPYWKCLVFYDDDDNEYSIQYKEYLENSSNAITPDLPTKEPVNSLSMEDEHLDTILETESDDVINSSVEDLVPIPSESEGIFDDTCNVPFCDNSPPLDVLNYHFELFSDFNDDCTSCDDFSPINVFEEKSVTFSNPLFNLNDDFTSSDDESLSDEDVPEDNVKIYLTPLFEFDDEYISSDVNPLFDEVLEDIECKDSYDSNLDESTFLVTPLSDSNEDEYFTPGDDVELLLHRDPSTPIMSVVSILEGFTDEPPLEENDDLFDLDSKKNDWKKVLYDTPIDDLMTEDKVFDLEIHDQTFSPTYVSLPFEDRHYLFFTYVVRIFLPHFTYLVEYPFLLSSGNEDTIFDSGISAFHFSHRS